LLVMMLRSEQASRQFALTAAAGLACGLAVLIKIVPIAAGGAVLAAVLLLGLVRRHIGVRRGVLLAVAFGVGASLPMILVALAYWRTGQFSTFIYANYGFASAYREQGRSGLAIGRQFIRVFGQLWPLVAFSTVTLAIAGRQMLALRPIPTLQFVCASWLAGELIAACASGHYEEHYFLTALPPLCLLAILGIAQIHRRLDSGASLAPLLLASSMAMVPIVPALARTVPPAITGSDLSAQATAAIKSAAHGREPTLLVADQDFSGLYMSTGAPVPSRYAQPLILMGGLSGLARSDMRLELRRVLASRPEFIVTNGDRPLPAWVTDELYPVLAGSYRQIATLSEDAVLDVGVRHRNDLYIYQRTEPPGHRATEARAALPPGSG
jgi:hypothetical protein